MRHYFNIDIPKRHSQCSHAEEKLVPGKEMFSAIFEEEERFVRKDFCSQCWEELRNDAKMEEAITTWKSLVPDKREAKDIFLDRDDKALALLNQFAESEKQEEVEQAMILALYLNRKRKLYQRKEITNEKGETTLLFEAARTQEVIAVKKIDLQTIDLDAIQKLIAAQLKS